MSNHEKVWFNVGGMRFWTKWSTLRQPMCSRLSRLSLSDPEYDPQTGEFCFDRSGVTFDCILDVHRTGKLHIPHNICVPKMLEEMEFWQIPPEKVACCCWTRIRDCSDSVKRQRTLRQTLGNYSCKDNGPTPNIQNSLDSTLSCCFGKGVLSVFKELRKFFSLALDKPFYSIKTKVSMSYTLVQNSHKAIHCAVMSIVTAIMPIVWLSLLKII